MTVNWNLYDSKFENTIESGSYIGELTKPDEIAEELSKTFSTWDGESILQIVKGRKMTRKNTFIYRVKFWKPVVTKM